MKTVSLLILTLGLAGCYSMAHTTDPVAAEQGIECEYDSFARTNICTGRHIVSKTSSFDLSSPSANSYLSIDLAKPYLQPTLIIRVNQTNGWTFPQQVIDSDGQRFKTIKIDSQIPMCPNGICVTWEYVAVNLTMDYLRQHAYSGFRMKTYGTRGNVIIDIPAPYIQGFLNFINNNY